MGTGVEDPEDAVQHRAVAFPLSTSSAVRWQEFKLLDIVAGTEDVPEQALVRGQMGTIVEVFEPGEYLIEFSDTNGEMNALESLRAEQLMLLWRSLVAPREDSPTAG